MHPLSDGRYLCAFININGIFCFLFQALAVQRYREQKEEERRRRLDEMRLRDSERRQQVEERKRQLFEAEREKRDAILKKNLVIIKIKLAYIYVGPIGVQSIIFLIRNKIT